MDTHDHRKTNTSGHENHICHRCGWPFPNPHPSAKHRRSHKKVCGTIDGYKLLLITSDNDEQQPKHHFSDSDDEAKTPSPKTENKNVKVIGSGGSGERSGKSEEEMFSDAVTEFSDSGKSAETDEHSACRKDSKKNAVNAGASELPSSQIESSKVGDVEVLESHETELVQDIQSKDEEKVEEKDVDRASANLVEPSGPGELLVSQTECSQVNEIEFLESPETKLVQGIQSKHEEISEGFVVHEALKDVAQPPSNDLCLNDSDIKVEDAHVKDDSEVYEVLAKKNELVDEVLAKTIEEEKVDEVSGIPYTSEINLQDTNGKNSPSLNEDGGFKSKPEQSGSGLGFSEDELPNKLESVDHVEVSASKVSESDTFEASETKVKEEETVYALSARKIDGELDEVLAKKIEEDEVNEVEGNIVEPLNKNTGNNLQDGDGKTPFVAHDESLLSKEGECGLGFETSEYNLPNEVEAVEHDVHVLSVASDLPAVEHAPTLIEDFKDHSAVKRDISNMMGSDEVNYPGDVTKGTDDDINPSESLKTCSSESKSTGGEYIGASEVEILETDVKDKTASGFQDSLTEVMVDQNMRDQEKNELSDVVVSERTEPAAAIEILEGDTNEKYDTDCFESSYTDRVPDSNEVNGTRNLMEPKEDLSARESPNEDQQVVSDIAVLSEDVGAVVHSELPLVEESSVRISEVPNLKGPESMPDAESITESFCTVQDEHSMDGGKIASQPMQEEFSDKLTKQHCASDASFDSSSQTSLEANCGSVSGLSTKSDAPVSIAAETSSTELQATAKSEENSEKSRAAQDSGIDEKAVSPEIKAVQKPQQPKSEEAAVAGSFPSLSDVNSEPKGRKKDEEVLTKVTMSSSGKHNSLFNLLGEASPDPRQVPSLLLKEDPAVKSALSSDAYASGKIETPKEWNSPARLPSVAKKNSKKVKGKTWVPLCCSSVNVS